MAITKTKFIENETLLQVTVHTPVMWAGLQPQMHVVLYPSGRTFAVTEELLNLHFTIVRPQEVVITAHGADGTDRPTSKQLDVERGTRLSVMSASHLSEALREPPAEDELMKARRMVQGV